MTSSLSLHTQEEEVVTLTATNDNQKPTLNIDKTKACYLHWSNITKTVEVKDQSSGLITSSLGDSKKQTQPPSSSSATATSTTAAAAAASDTKVILNQISGRAKPGEILALMGPSGSGKTSLLDVLASRSSYNDGTIYLNNISMTDNPTKMKSLKRKIAYIKQKDIFFEHLSVKDQLIYTAFLRLGDDYSKEEKIDEVNKVIELLRLHKCADTPIKLVSGGERKRVNIGTELLTNPSIIMLDEPTSGLDSTSAVALMSLLVSLAHDHGKTVITSIHQPSSAVFHKFDSLLFLADGCVVYHGSPKESLLYCQKLGYACPNGYNAADHWMDLLVEDSAIPTNSVKEEKKEEEISSSFPILLSNVHDDVESNLNNRMMTKIEENNDDEATKLTLTSASTNATMKTTRKGVGSLLSRKLSSMTQTSTKGKSQLLFELTKMKRNEYVKLTNPKARLITAWDVDHYTAQIEQEGLDYTNDNENGSLHSAGTLSSDIKDEVETENKFNTSWSTQFRILLHRSLKNSRSAIWTPLNFFKSIALAVLTGLLWFQIPNDELHISDRHSFIFFSITYWIFDGTFTAIFTFPSEREIIFKERASGSYYLSAYFLSKTISEIPTRLSLPFIFWTIAYWMSGVNPHFHAYIATLGCMLLAVLAGESYGLLCGALVMDFEKAMTIMVVISLTTMAAGGFYVQNIPPWVAWVKYLSPFKFGYEASQVIIFDSEVLCDGSGTLAEYCKEGVEYASREDILDFLNSEGSVAFNIGILLILIIVPRYLSFIALKAKRGAERS